MLDINQIIEESTMTTRTTEPKTTPKLENITDIKLINRYEKRCVATDFNQKTICNNIAQNNSRKLCNFHNWEYLYSKKEAYTEVK